MTLLDSLGDHVQDELILLAPAGGRIPMSFARRDFNPNKHALLLREAQRVRGSIYLADGALQPSQLTADGRHVQDADYDSWHLLAVNGNGEVQGCARYRHLTGRIGFDDLGVRDSWLAKCGQWGASLKAAVESEIARANRRGSAFSEVGGWAVAPEKRSTIEALRIAIATYSLARLLGGCVGITTATQRHRSSSILRRIGGRPLSHGGTELPSYFDPQYQCQMEVLRFDSNSPNGSCRRWVELLSRRLNRVSVVAARDPVGTHYVPRLQPVPVAWRTVAGLRWVT